MTGCSHTRLYWGVGGDRACRKPCSFLLHGVALRPRLPGEGESGVRVRTSLPEPLPLWGGMGVVQGWAPHRNAAATVGPPSRVRGQVFRNWGAALASWATGPSRGPRATMEAFWWGQPRFSPRAPGSGVSPRLGQGLGAPWAGGGHPGWRAGLRGLPACLPVRPGSPVCPRSWDWGAPSGWSGTPRGLAGLARCLCPRSPRLPDLPRARHCLNPARPPLSDGSLSSDGGSGERPPRSDSTVPRRPRARRRLPDGCSARSAHSFIR